jgi:hypothetical protein
MHTIPVRPRAGGTPTPRVRRLGVLALLAILQVGILAVTSAAAWGQLDGRPIAQPCFDFPNWARYSGCRPDPLPWGYDVFPDYGPIDGQCGSPYSVACEVPFVAHRPSDWYAIAEFAPLTLDYHDDFDPAVLGLGAAPALDTGDLRPEFDAGGKFTVGRRIFDCYRLEGTYLGAYDWSDTVIDADTGDTFAFESELQSGEINLRYWAAMPPGPFDFSYSIGGRYIRIAEQFTFDPGALTVNTENDMWGVQVGLQAQCLKTTRWWLDVDLKGGMYNNAALVATDLGGVGGFGERDRTAWVGDLSMALNWQATPNIAFRIGYQGLFMSGLALAPQNAVANADLIGTGGARLDDSGEVTYHGPTIGVVWIR